MAIGDELLSLLHNLLALHWLYDFRKNRLVHRRRLPPACAMLTDPISISAIPTKIRFKHTELFIRVSPFADTATSNGDQQPMTEFAKASTVVSEVRLRHGV
jgi:hypothetical protein